jgi:hypothetical protein
MTMRGKRGWVGAVVVSIWLIAVAPVDAQTGTRFGVPPIGGQTGTRLGVAPDPIDQSKSLSTRPTPALPAPKEPVERLVPERRVFVPELGREVVIPPHYERRLSDQQYQVPPLSGFGTRGEGPLHIPGGDRPPADLRQSP